MGNSLFKGSRTASILCCGLDNSGKTTILSHLSTNNNTNDQVILPTPGMQRSTFHKFSTDWKVWDCSGTGPNRKLWPLFYQYVSGIIFVVDASDRERISCAKDELEAILSANEFRKRKTSVLILFNKMDIEDTPNIAELETVLRLSQMRQQQRNIDMHLQACSGIKGSGIEEGFRWLADSVNSVA
jgi:small GTP-binding protein